MSAGKIDPKVIVTSRLPFTDVTSIFETARKPTQIKVMIQMDRDWKWIESDYSIFNKA